MNAIKKIIKIIFASFLIITAHLAAILFFPYPFNQINVALTILTILLIINNQIELVWTALAVGLLMENFLASSFGINIVAMVAANLAVYWLYNNIFTHRSAYMTMFLSAIMILIYRVIFIFGSFVVGFFMKNFFFNTSFLIKILWEIGVSSIASMIIYLFLTLVFKYLRPEYLSNKSLYEKTFRWQ